MNKIAPMPHTSNSGSPPRFGAGTEGHGTTMSRARRTLSRPAWLRVYRLTGLLSAVSVVLSIIFTNLIMETFSAGINVPGLMVSIFTPLLLGTPLIGIILYKQEQLREANSRLERLASTDWLTGCLNRGAFTAEVTRLLGQPRTYGAMLVVDVDHFKTVNDRLGHDRGDDVLKLIAEALARAVGADALLGRLGGEEFGIFLPQADDKAARKIAETIRDAVARIGLVFEGRSYPLSISVGGATFEGPSDFRSLYRLADDFLYRAKAAGRDRVALSSAA